MALSALKNPPLPPFKKGGVKYGLNRSFFLIEKNHLNMKRHIIPRKGEPRGREGPKSCPQDKGIPENHKLKTVSP